MKVQLSKQYKKPHHKPLGVLTFKDDLEYKKNKIQEMINYVEKKIVRKAPKYFGDYETFPLRVDDFVKYNCMSVCICR